MNEVLQHWDGYVSYLDEHGVEVVLVDVTAGDKMESEVALIPRAHINPATWVALKLGTHVTWKIENTPTSTVSRFSLTPVGKWTQEELDAADAKAKQLAASLGWL